MALLHISDIEAAINHWRRIQPSTDGITLPAEQHALAELYAQMVLQRQTQVDESALAPAALDAFVAWYNTTPDTPCIAICSTSQGDDVCKGCGRRFEEVQHWPAMTVGEKRAVWRRIHKDASAWRFNRYAERAAENRSTP